MIEKVLIDYLSVELNLPVYALRPDNAPDTYVVIDKTGGNKTNRVETATVAIQSYAPTMLGAIKLNEDVKDAMESITALPKIGGVSLITDQNYPDLTRKVPRYQSIFNITYY